MPLLSGSRFDRERSHLSRVCSGLLVATLLGLTACRARPSPVTVVATGNSDTSGLESRVEALERRVEHLERELMRRSSAAPGAREPARGHARVPPTTGAPPSTGGAVDEVNDPWVSFEE